MTADEADAAPVDAPRRLTLHRPIVFLDIATTGPDHRTARIVRLSTLRVEPDGSEEFRSHLINPLTPISPGASRFHGITDDLVAVCNQFSVYASGLHRYLADCDLAGFGIRRFHLKVLQREFAFANLDFDYENRTVLDAMELFHRLEPRDFDAAYRRYVGGELPRPAEGEVAVTAVRDIIDGQLQSDAGLPSDPATIAAWACGRSPDATGIDDHGRFIRSEDGDPLINFGRYRGYTLHDMSAHHADYLRWIARSDRFTIQQRKIAADAIAGIMP